MQLLQSALENPWEFPALRKALTPDDRLTIVYDRLPQLGQLLKGLLEYLVEVGIEPSAITILSAPWDTKQSWLDDLPEDLEEIRCETHNPSNPKELAYLATTESGRRLYFNQHLVHADQVIVLCGRRYDPFLGHGGVAGSLFPLYSNEETLAQLTHRPSLELPDSRSWPLMEEAVEASWLLGVPFFIQVIEGRDDQIEGIVAGVVESAQESQRQQDARWRKAIPHAVQTVVADLTGDPSRHTFQDFADALVAAVRVLRPRGQILLLTDATPEVTTEVTILQQAGDPTELLSRLSPEQAFAHRAAWQWATVAEQAQIFLLSGWEDDLVEDLFAVPLANREQAQRLIDASETSLHLEDAHKTLAVLES